MRAERAKFIFKLKKKIGAKIQIQNASVLIFKFLARKFNFEIMNIFLNMFAYQKNDALRSSHV